MGCATALICGLENQTSLVRGPQRSGRSALLPLRTIRAEIRERVGALVLVAADVRDRRRVELREELYRAAEEGQEMLGLDGVAAVELAGHQLAVGDHGDARAAEGPRLLQRANEGAVLGNVVRADS